ncbi:glycoside hydrolase family 17 protein [Lineolata rhizophorae]|uniref:Probable glucan endo-1,3-beta-glucosidase eglC n=1 Tax=Lineolata rhizophorae TaxID=578093 RepID=A0A6A6NQW6_9PEZI|nr:glycoside hydrolase family 17 protein [Lineolata rhizophorae]
MRFLSVATALIGAITGAEAYWKGFNVGANNPDGSCKTQADWETAFTVMQSQPGYFTSFRLFASSDCDTLARAVPAAISTGSQLLVGVWATDDGHFGAEKAALEAAINQYGTDWMIAISVGSEDLYRGDISGDYMAQKIYDVRGMVRAMGVDKEVGHVDTWTAWVDAANEVVITACDFVGMDGYPYFQGATIEQAPEVFWQSVTDTRNAVNRVKPGTWVWVTETGHPVSGDNFGPSVASVSNAQSYWNRVACECFNSVHVFWYAYQDYNSNPSFGVIDANLNSIYDLSC